MVEEESCNLRGVLVACILVRAFLRRLGEGDFGQKGNPSRSCRIDRASAPGRRILFTWMTLISQFRICGCSSLLVCLEKKDSMSNISGENKFEDAESGTGG